MITCCRNCVPPKRYPGCHDHCPEYLAQKAIHEAERVERFKKNEVNCGIYEQRSAAIAKVVDKRRHKRNGLSAKVIK